MRRGRLRGLESVAERVVGEVHRHAQRRLTLFGGVVVDVLVFQPVPQVASVRIEYNQPSIVNNAVGARGAPVVLVNLG